MTRRIPERQPIGDSFEGAVLRVADHDLLATTPRPQAPANTSSAVAPEEPVAVEIVQTGIFTVRYAICYLGKPHLCIIPGLLALDTGEMMTGEKAWDFILHRSNLYPRADVQGYRQDGEEDMVFIKELDIMRPIQLLVYADDEATTPIAQTRTVITPNPAALAERIREYAHIFPSIQEWQIQHES